MKKLLILITILACMGCEDRTLSDTLGPGLPGGCEQTESCIWPMYWDSGTCSCEW